MKKITIVILTPLMTLATIFVISTCLSERILAMHRITSPVSAKIVSTIWDRN